MCRGRRGKGSFVGSFLAMFIIIRLIKVGITKLYIHVTPPFPE